MKRTDVLMALVACFALGACAPKARDNSANIRMDGARPAALSDGSASGVDTSVGAFSNKCSNGTSSVGLIKDDPSLSVGGSTFKSRVGDLVSASLDPQQLGEIEGAGATGTGLDLYVKLKADAQGQVASDSALQILIYDSFVGQIDSQSGQQIQPYPIVITKGAQGVLNRSQRSFQVSFSDAYGTVILEGTFDDSMARGTVRFSNTRSFDNGAPRSGQLGQFVIPACNLF